MGGGRGELVVPAHVGGVGVGDGQVVGEFGAGEDEALEEGGGGVEETVGGVGAGREISCGSGRWGGGAGGLQAAEHKLVVVFGGFIFGTLGAGRIVAVRGRRSLPRLDDDSVPVAAHNPRHLGR